MIKEDSDSLLWTKNVVGGSYSPKLGYKDLREMEPIPYLQWWFKIICKFKCSLTTRIFMWLVINNKVPMWDFFIEERLVGS